MNLKKLSCPVCGKSVFVGRGMQLHLQAHIRKGEFAPPRTAPAFPAAPSDAVGKVRLALDTLIHGGQSLVEELTAERARHESEIARIDEMIAVLEQVAGTVRPVDSPGKPEAAA